MLNDIFRNMHSLKGASGFLGLNRINQLAHKSENILDELRKGSMVVTSEIMDVILASTDALRRSKPLWPATARPNRNPPRRKRPRLRWETLRLPPKLSNR